MTAQLLSSELSTLLQESKRKNPELRKHVEKSLEILNGLPRTSEAQITADLRSRVDFVSPFLVACQTRNPKFAGNAVACLQRLIVANALPKDALVDVLDALKEVSSLALDIQLKVLQALPSLVQNYGAELRQHLLISAFQICFQLYGSKTAVVTNLAAAGIKQLVSSTFDKIASFQPSSNGKNDEIEDHNNTELKHLYRLDAFAVYRDICLLIEGSKPETLEGAFLSQAFAFELVETILSDHVTLICDWPEGTWPIDKNVIPVITKILSGKAPFTVTVRCLRLVELILRTLLDNLPSESESLLSLLTHLLDPDAAPLWKRACCLEVLRNLNIDNGRIRNFYSMFDAQDEKRNVVRDQLGALVRLASEKPAVIGLGQQSSVPIASVDDSSEQAAIQAGGLVGTIGSSAPTLDINTPGISNQWSDIKVSLLDQIEKAEPMPVPATYIYRLALNCLVTFEEGLARFLLPFTVPKERKSKRKQGKTDVVPVAETSDGTLAAESITKEKKSVAPINPITLIEHPMYGEISNAAQMVDNCWPALLATSSTFFNASMDSENFHALIRAFQKFTQIAGLLELSTPRDAFLTTLGKHALPASKIIKPSATPSLGSIEDMSIDSANETSRDSSPAPTTPKIRPPVKRQQTSTVVAILNSRHLLCLRALLNLGIALGPSLHNAWSIIIETLQQADLLMTTSSSVHRRPRSRDASTNAGEEGDENDLGLEITAAETAASRLFEGTREFEDAAFREVLQCLRNLLQEETETGEPPTPADDKLSPISARPKHQKLRSFSGTPNEAEPKSHDSVFVLDKMGQVIRCNITRLLGPDNSRSGWDLIFDCLLVSLSTRANDRSVRLGAASVLNEMLVLCAVSDSPEARLDAVRTRSLKGILDEVTRLYMPMAQQSRNVIQCDLDIHRSALDALRAILDQCGESLESGWLEVFGIILSAFHDAPSSDITYNQDVPQPRSPALVRASFGSIELICSDFLSSVPHSCILQLLDTLHRFASQPLDLNISLTTSTFFQTLSDYMLRDQAKTSLEAVEAEQLISMATMSSAHKATTKLETADLWLILLIQLARLTTDSRLEARHSTIHTIFKIIMGSGLTRKSLSIVYDAVISPMLSYNEVSFERDRSIAEEAEEWNSSIVLVIENVAKVCGQWLDTFGTDGSILEVIQRLLEQMESPLRRQSFQISKAVFGGTSKMLAEIDDQCLDGTGMLPKAWTLWNDNNPVQIAVAHGEDNNEALLAYLFCLGQLLRLNGPDIEPRHAECVLDHLLRSVQGASASPYSSDVDTMTTVQKAALESIKMLPRLSGDYDVKLVELIKQLANLAYEPRPASVSSHATFVALSKSSMALLDSMLAKRMTEKAIDQSSSLPFVALSALQKPLQLKYRWAKPGRDPSPWKKATTTATSIIQTFAPNMSTSSPTALSFWSSAVSSVIAIINADPPSRHDPSTISLDETFDIKAFTTLHPLLVSALNSPSIPTDLREQYSSALFTASLIHTPHPDDIAQPGAPLLSGLDSDHFGQVKDLPPNPRSQLSYLLLTTLRDLCSVAPSPSPTSPSVPPAPSPRAPPPASNTTSQNNHLPLATAATPYLLLRLALTLKAYIYDQPLRGHFPTPASIREEMRVVLGHITSARLSSEKDVRGALEGEIRRGQEWWARGKGGEGSKDGQQRSSAHRCWGPGSLSVEGEGKRAGWALCLPASSFALEVEGAKEEAEGSREKWLVGVLYPLLLRALRAARKDREMEREIQKVLMGMMMR